MKRNITKENDEHHHATADGTEHKASAAPEIDRFVGPIGAIAMMIGLPLLVQFLFLSCSQYQCSQVETFNHLRQMDLKTLYFTIFPSPNLYTLQIFAAWFLVQFAMHVIIPGYYYLGFEIFDGSKLTYKINGLACYLLTLGAFVYCAYTGVITHAHMTEFFNNFGSLITTCHYAHTLFCVLLYLKGYLFKQGNPCGNPLVDYFYGYEPNPRFFDVIVTDVKWVMEGRALTLWVLIAFALAYKQYLNLGVISTPMILSCLFHFAYVLHYNVYETNVLAMVDFTSEHHGWMLQWGNGVFVPFVYTMPEWYALILPKTVSFYFAVFCVALYAAGYFLFSQANLQKKEFRSNPKALIWGKPPKTLKTANGKELLLSGWWGVARKINYTGDLIQAFCYGLPCQAYSVVPFINFIFLFVLLVQREGRDSRFCKKKYGEDWDRYCKLVPYKLIPYVY